MSDAALGPFSHGRIIRYQVGPAIGGDPDKVFLRNELGEGGGFSRAEFVDAIDAGFAAGDMDAAIDRFFWENF